MKDIQSLTNMLNELDDLLVNCMKCGLCQGVCPVFSETHNESDVTRGKIYMLEGLAKQMISDAKGVKTRIEKCLLCGTCAANCPSGVSAIEIFVLARSIMTNFIGLSAVKKAIFRGMVSNPRLFNAVLDLSKKFQGLFISPANKPMGTYCSGALTSFIGDRHFAPLAKQPFHKVQKKLTREKQSSEITVTYFPGCVVDKIYPRVAEASLKVLHSHNIKVSVPDVQVCCGIPALASGEGKTFNNLFEQNIKQFKEVESDYILTPCATCTSTLKKIWPMVTKNQDAESLQEAQMVADKTLDVSEFLVDVLRVSPPALSSGKGKRVTYHDPCHLGKSLGIINQPRELMKNHANLELVEMKDANVCCGNGGSFNLQHYELSSAIGDKKCDNIEATEAEIVATSCPACMMQLTDLLSKRNKSIEVKHVMELL